MLSASLYLQCQEQQALSVFLSLSLSLHHVSSTIVDWNHLKPWEQVNPSFLKFIVFNIFISATRKVMTTANIYVLISHIMTKMGKEYIRWGKKTYPVTCLRWGETRYCLFISKAAIMLRYDKKCSHIFGFCFADLWKK